jgi:hypothetical protein
MTEHDDVLDEWTKKAQFWRGFSWGVFWALLVVLFLMWLT